MGAAVVRRVEEIQRSKGRERWEGRVAEIKDYMAVFIATMFCRCLATSTLQFVWPMSTTKVIDVRSHQREDP